ncbi:MAG: HAD hydrolase family protein, partial [Hungatella sp.]
MSIKLIALDLDGTLLDSKKQLSIANRQALIACIEKGIFIVPATGRTLSGIPEDVKNLPGVRYAITINGAVVIDTLEHHVLQEAKLEINTALSIFDMVQGYHIMYDAYVDGVGISEARFYDRLDEYKISKEIQTLIRATRVVYPDLREAVLEKGKPVEKINLFFRDQEEREKVRQLLAGRGDV